MLTSAQSVLAAALSSIFKGQTGPAEIRILNYRDEQTFSDLWLKGLNPESPTVQIAGKSVDWNDAHVTFLIANNNPPDEIFANQSASLGNINFRDHFTASSWLAAWKLRNPEAKARIAIVDPNTPEIAAPTARTLQTILGAKDSSGHSLVPSATVLSAPRVQSICQWIHDAKKDSSPNTPPNIRELLKSTIWNALTSDREKHHAISNVLGASLLRSATKGEEAFASKIDELLHQLAESLVDISKHVEKAAWWEQASWEAHYILLDDMAELWSPFLRGALGPAGSQLHSTPRMGFYEAIGKVPERLSEFLKRGTENITANDLHQLWPKTRDFVLFLDLRLYPKTDLTKARNDDEKMFLNGLVEFGLKLLNSERNLPWLNGEKQKNALREELNALKRGTSPTASVDSSTPPPEETLLARLLSLIDPTLPIIIFSSAHRTELIDPFRDYGNIITTFRKPILTGMARDWPTIVKELRSDFVSAMEEAARVLRLRAVIRTFQDRSQKKAPRVVLPKSDNGSLIEIFIDESEAPTEQRPPRPVCAGGIVVVRALGPSGEPLISDGAVFKALAEKNCLWGWCADTPDDFMRPKNVPQKRGFMPKGKDLNFVGGGQGPALLAEMIISIREILADRGCIFPFAAISNRTNPFPKWMEGPKGTDPWNVEKILDATLRRLVQHVLEGLLFRSEVLRAALDQPKSSIAIDLGIRDYPCRPNWPLFETFGFEVQRGYRPSFHSEDGYQITSETLSRTGMPWPFRAGIVRARAVALKDFGTATRPNSLAPKQLHYFADTVSHVALDDVDAATNGSDVVREFFESGWFTDFRVDTEEQSRLEIGRAWDQGDRVEAVLWAASLKEGAPLNGVGIDVYGELNQGAASLVSPDLKKLFACL